MESRGAVILRYLTGVEGVAYRFADKNEQGQQYRQGEKGGNAKPRCLNIVFTL